MTSTVYRNSPIFSFISMTEQLYLPKEVIDIHVYMQTLYRSFELKKQKKNMEFTLAADFEFRQCSTTTEMNDISSVKS